MESVDRRDDDRNLPCYQSVRFRGSFRWLGAVIATYPRSRDDREEVNKWILDSGINPCSGFVRNFIDHGDDVQ